MPSIEITPPRSNQSPERNAEQFPHFSIPGFEQLSSNRQAVFLTIPPDKLSMARPVIEKEIAGLAEVKAERSQGDSDQYQAAKIESEARTRLNQSKSAIETFHRAENGDPQAAEELMDFKKELLGEEPKVEEVWEVVFRKFSNQVLATDEKAAEWHDLFQQIRMQEVADMFHEFRGDMGAVDEILRPSSQITLFDALSPASGAFDKRLHAVHETLMLITHNKTLKFSNALQDWGLVKDGQVLNSGVSSLKQRIAQFKEQGHSEQLVPALD